MSHMVIFRTPEGKPGYQPAETVQDAVAVVERLRNDDGVENVRIFRLEEVQFELRPYFKVELAGGVATDDADASSDDTPALDGAADPGEGAAPSIFGGSDVASDSAGSDDSHVEATETTGTESGDEPSTAGDVPPPPSAAHPPWAAPPPPPAPVDPPSVGEPGDEFSGAGQRRGLFGR